MIYKKRKKKHVFQQCGQSALKALSFSSYSMWQPRKKRGGFFTRWIPWQTLLTFIIIIITILHPNELSL